MVNICKNKIYWHTGLIHNVDFQRGQKVSWKKKWNESIKCRDWVFGGVQKIKTG